MLSVNKVLGPLKPSISEKYQRKYDKKYFTFDVYGPSCENECCAELHVRTSLIVNNVPQANSH